MNRVVMIPPLNITKGRFGMVKPLLLALVVLLSACLKDDEPVKAHQPGNAITASFNLGTYYRYQGYFDLATNTFVSQNLKTDWDLAFDNRPGNFNIIINGAKFCKIANMGPVDMGSVTDTVGAHWKVDTNTGNLDSTAIGKWYTSFTADTVISANNVYILDRGYDENNNHLGYKKFLISGNNDAYQLISYNLDNTGLTFGFMPRDNADNFFTYFSFDNVLLPTPEPPQNAYDLIFTQYTFVYHTVDYPDYPYLVTGVVINRNNVKVAADSLRPFESITLADTASMDFDNRIDAIGYDWKDFDLNGSGLYSVKQGKNYVIRSRNGLYYKFHFLDFYKDGIKGNILFEYQLL